MPSSRAVLFAFALGSTACASVASPSPEKRGDPARPVTSETEELASGVVTTSRIGSEIVVARLEAEARIALYRVTPKGLVRSFAPAALPKTERVRSLSGHDDVLSGTPTAFLGDLDGPLWIGWSTYSMFGATSIYRAERGVFACVGICRPSTDAEPWADRLEALPEASKGLVHTRSGRGHLFVVTNLVSGEGDEWYALPDPVPRDPKDAVRRIVPIGVGGIAYELEGGAIVHYDETRVTCLAHGRTTSWPIPDDAPFAHVARRGFGALGCRDYVFQVGLGELWRWREGRATRLEAPRLEAQLHVADDATIWLEGEDRQAYGFDGVRWTRLTWTGPPHAWDRIVAITPDALYIERSRRNEPTSLLRVVRHQ